MTPAAGPDSMVVTARRRAIAADMTPPADSMTNNGASHADCLQTRLEVGEIARHDRTDEGRHHGGGRAFVLANLGPDVARQHDIDRCTQHVAQDLADAPFVLRVHVGMQQAHRDRADVEGAYAPRELRNCRDVEGLDDLTVGRDAFGHFERQRGIHRRRRRFERQVVSLVFDPRVASELQEAAEPTRGDVGDRDIAALEDRVGGQRRTVHDPSHRLGRDARVRERELRTRDRSVGRMVRCGQLLDDRNHAVRTGNDDVGEGAADVDAESERAGHARV